MNDATLTVIRTSPDCLSYRLTVAGRVLFTTRAFANERRSHQGARQRVATWAARHGVRVRDERGRVVERATAEVAA